jgi:hypothetical protein
MHAEIEKMQMVAGRRCMISSTTDQLSEVRFFSFCQFDDRASPFVALAQTPRRFLVHWCVMQDSVGCLRCIKRCSPQAVHSRRIEMQGELP